MHSYLLVVTVLSDTVLCVTLFSPVGCCLLEDFAMKRKPMSGKSSRKSFRRGDRVHAKNAPRVPMRGGIRL